MGGFSTIAGYDDGLTGDGFGSGFTDSTVGFEDGAAGDAFGGSGVTDSGAGLDTSSDFNIEDFYGFDAGTLPDQLALAQNTESAPSPFYDGGMSESGSGSAAPAAARSYTSGANWNTALSSLAKFGSSFASLVSGASSSTPRPALTPTGAPLRPQSGPVNGAHFTLIILVVFGIGLALAFSGERKGS